MDVHCAWVRLGVKEVLGRGLVGTDCRPELRDGREGDEWGTDGGEAGRLAGC